MLHTTVTRVACGMRHRAVLARTADLTLDASCACGPHGATTALSL
jgi:hypothetical protein